MKIEIEEIIDRLESEGKDVYFRVSSQNDDLKGNSIEYPNITREEAAEIYGFDVEDLDEDLDGLWLYYDDKKEGVFWDGICVTASIESMAEYYRSQMGSGMGVEGLYLFIVTGEYITDTQVSDGEVIQNAQIVKRFEAPILSEWFEV